MWDAVDTGEVVQGSEFNGKWVMIKKARCTMSIQDIMFSVSRRCTVPALGVVLSCFCTMAKLTCVKHCYIVGNALSLKLNSNLGIESGENGGPYLCISHELCKTNWLQWDLYGPVWSHQGGNYYTNTENRISSCAHRCLSWDASIQEEYMLTMFECSSQMDRSVGPRMLVFCVFIGGWFHSYP